MPSTSNPIATLDGMDEHTGTQQTHAAHPQLQVNDLPISEDLPPTDRQCQATNGGHAPHHSNQQQCGQPTQQLDAYQNVYGQYQSRDFSQTTQDLESSVQHYNSARQSASRTATARPSDAPRAPDHVQARHLSDILGATNPETQVKQEPANEEHNGHDIFAEFTNEDYHVDNNGAGDDNHQQGLDNSDSSATQPPAATPLIKPEPEPEAQLLSDATTSSAPTGLVGPTNHGTTAAPVATQHTQAASSIERPATFSPLNGVPVTPSDAMRTPYSAEVHHDLVNQDAACNPEIHQTTVNPVFNSQHSAEKYAQVLEQPGPVSQAPSAAHVSFRSPSADSVIVPSRRNSKETTFSPSSFDLESNQHMLAQQFAKRQQLFDMDALNAEAVQANPRLLHGPSPTQQGQGRSVPMPPAEMFFGQPGGHLAPNGSSLGYAQHTDVPSGRSNIFHRGHMQGLSYPPARQTDAPYPVEMSYGFTSNVGAPHAPMNGFAPTQRYPVPGSYIQPRVTEVKEEDGFEASDDDEPLSTRVPRHRSITASPTSSAAVIQPMRPSDNEAASKKAAKVDTSGPKQDSVIELSDDDGEAAEPISWKLPDFEATYYPPTKEDGMPTSKVSIPGLVREEVALTEDHAEQEMQLFLNVFLPIQQGLQAPDPEPAHAVLNFHTISVIVIETFEQYEIGDEMGRGYGFHGGNITGQIRRPSPASADEELVRTRSAKDADVDEIFFAVVDRWRAGLISGKETFKRIRGCQEFCDIALDIIHYVKKHGLLQPEPKKRRVRSDKGVTRGPRGGAKEAEAKGKVTAKRKADAVDGKAVAKKGTKAGKPTVLESRKKAKIETKKAKPKASKSGGVTVVNSRN